MKVISAIICTHNGQKTINTAIQSLISQTLPKTDYEILVVDNVSNDNTRDIVKSYDGRKILRYLSEPTLGLSNARNKGWKEAASNYIAYLDDDAIACPEWLERILEAFRTVRQAGAVGGKVELIWEVDPPPWVNEIMMRFLSVLDWSTTPIILDDSQYLVGTNIAFPRALLEQFSGFSIDLGRKGTSLISNEETELIAMMKKGGHIVYYDPQILVRHFTPSSRLKPSWFIRRWFTQGISDAIVYKRTEKPSASEKLIYVKAKIKEIVKRPQDLVLASFPHLFTSRNLNCHEAIVNLGFLYGLLRTGD